MKQKILFALAFISFGCEKRQVVTEMTEHTIDQDSDQNQTIKQSEEFGQKNHVGNDKLSMKKQSVKLDSFSVDHPVDEVARIQGLLMKANLKYQGQGKLHQENGRVIAAEFPGCELKDLSPLRGLNLEALDLSGNPVREIRHLRGMPLVRLFLEYTLVESLEDLRDANLVEIRLNGSPVRSLSGLEGQPLENLYAVGTQIKNINALKSSQLRQLWLTESPVSDFSPLAGLPLVSLTAHRTLLEDLSFVRKLPLIQRLHIGETLVTDLSPLAGLNLTRLVFSPERIEQGLDVAKSLSNIKEIGTKFDDKGRDLSSPDVFWAQF
jgi:internalin A